MASTDMFGKTEIQERCFYDYAVAGDLKGAKDRLYSLSLNNAVREILNAGFGCISHTSNSKAEFIAHAIRQIGRVLPCKIDSDF